MKTRSISVTVDVKIDLAKCITALGLLLIILL